MQYKFVACAGTFDFLHIGHKAFLRFAFSLGEQVLIGITTDVFIEKMKKQGQVASFATRKAAVLSFLQQEHFFARATIVPLDDIYGPTLQQNSPIDALVVTTNTKENAEAINQERTKRQLPELPIILMPLVKTGQEIVSSSAIRKGVMNQNGEHFITNAFLSYDLKLPDTLREKLHKPFGTIIEDPQAFLKQLPSELIISVGDVTTTNFNKWGIKQKLSIIDFTVERKKSYETIKQLGFHNDEEVFSIHNAPGIITRDVWKAITQVLQQFQTQKQFVIFVEGEEDLFVIPLLLCLPLGYHIFYGQPHVGLVHIVVTLEAKEAMLNIIRGFEPVTTRGY